MSQSTTVPIHNSVKLPFKIARNLEEIHNGTNSVFSIVPKVPAKGTLEVYENSIKYYHPDQTIPNCEPPEREENDIKEFSAKSRQRLFQKFNKINYSSYGIPLFLSLTWHHDFNYDRKGIKLFLRNYLKRLIRLLPPFDYIWKFEYQKRGTPHFHIVIFPHDKKNNFDTDFIKSEIKKHWLELKQCKCNHCKEYAVKTIKLETLKMALSYISKEIAKVSQNYCDHDLGRIWGSSNKLRCNKVDELNITLNEFELFLDKAIEEVDNKISKTDSQNITQKTKLEKSKLYLLGLKYIPNNSTVFIPSEKIKDLIIKLKFSKNVKNISSKLILKKYNWR